MASFHHFQNQAEQKSKNSKPTSEGLTLSGVMQYAESARKLNFEALCRVQPLVKTYRDRVQQTSLAIVQEETKLQGEAEIPAGYAAALKEVKEGFKVHLGSLDEWMSAMTQKRESDAERAMAKVQESGQQLETCLQGLEAGKSVSSP